MKKELYKELEEIDSSLPKYKKDDIYTASDAYFDKMQESVLTKLKEKEESSKVVSLGINKWIMGIAASLIILVAAVFAFNHRQEPIDQIASSDIIEYLNIYVDDLNDSDFAMFLSEDDFSLAEETTLTSDDIENYLENNIDDINEEDLQQLF